MILYKGDNEYSGVNKENGNKIGFFSSVEINKDLIYVSEGDIFSIDGVLVKDGCLCIRRYLKIESSGVILDDQEFYQVVFSYDIKNIPIGSLIICRERTAFKLLEDEVWIGRNNTLLVISLEKGFQPGPDYEMLKMDERYVSWDVAETVKSAEGKFFPFYSHRIVIGGTPYILVKKEDVKLKIRFREGPSSLPASHKRHQ